MSRVHRELDHDILRLAVPAFATLVAEPLYILTDTAIIGHLGTDELAGLALASTVLITGYSVFLFLAYGTTATVGRLLGAGRDEEAAAQAVQGLWLAAGLGVLLSVIGFFGGATLVAALGGRGIVAAHAERYLRISLIGFPAVLVGLACLGYLRALQNTRTPLLVAAGSALGNLVLEWLLIYRAGFGIGASAAATVLAQGVATLILVGSVRQATKAHRGSWRPQLRRIRQLLGVGVHLLLRTAALRGALVMAAAVAAHLGRDQLAAYQVGYEIWSFLALALDALAIAAQALVARALGAATTGHAVAIGKRVNQLGFAVGTALGLGVLLLRGPLASVFSADPAVVALISSSLVLVAVSQPINGWVFALDGTLIGAGDQRYLAKAMPAAFAVFCPAALAVRATHAGLGWLWAAVLLFMVARLVALQSRFVRGHWLLAATPS